MVRFSLVPFLTAFVYTNATPINKVTYRELTDGLGNTGACRGNGGAVDRVDSRYKIVTAQSDCENECDGDEGCIAYAYRTDGSDCVIYGPGQDGLCGLATNEEMSIKYHNFQSCGDCSLNGVDMPSLRTQNVCGSCSKEISATLSNSEGVCSTYDGVWTTGDWTEGMWEERTDDWDGESYTHASSDPTLNVHTISASVGFHCYDKVHEDGQPTCSGSDGQCQTDFEDMRTADHCPEGCVFYPRDDTHGPYCDGLSADGETSCIVGFETSGAFSQEMCMDGCTYTAAPEWTAPAAALHAPPIDLGPGWMPEVIKATENSGDCTGSTLPQCENKTHIAGFGYGVCRIDQVGLPNGAHINQKWCANCVNTRKERVNLNEAACAQTCLDDPSGTCVAFSQTEGANCIIYGVDVDQYLRNPGDVENEWKGWTYKNEPCIGDKVPVGCTPINTIKPNPKFLCRHLMTDKTRWLAWGPADSGSNDIVVELTVEHTLSGMVTKDDFSDDMTSMLKSKMATVAFVDAGKDVDVMVTDSGDGKSATATLTITASDSAVIPMTGLLDTVLISKTRDGSLYFYNEISGSGGNRNSGAMLPMGTHISGIMLKGMRHNLLSAEKELYTRGWSENGMVSVVESDSEPVVVDKECPECKVCDEGAVKTSGDPGDDTAAGTSKDADEVTAKGTSKDAGEVTDASTRVEAAAGVVLMSFAINMLPMLLQ